MTPSPLAIGPAQVIVPVGDSLTAGSPDATFRYFLPLQASITALFNGWGFPPPTWPGVVALGGWTSKDLLDNVASIIALAPDHVLGVPFPVNDFFNHGGTPIPPTGPGSTQANLAAIMAAVLAARPTCKFHWGTPMWSNGEKFPLGANGPTDALVTATCGGVQAAVAAAGGEVAEYIDIRNDIWPNYSPLYNPGNAASGFFVQGDLVHPTKPLGVQTLSNRIFRQLKFRAP